MVSFDPVRGSEQGGTRPAAVLDDLGGTIYCGQILTVSRLRLGNYVARLPDHIMLDVDDALARYLAL